MTTSYRYFPDAGALSEALGGRLLSQLILVGHRTLDEVEAHETRWIEPPEVTLANGAYLFVRSEQTEAMVVASGKAPRAAESLDGDAPPDHALSKAEQWFDFFWGTAAPVGPRPRFVVGDHAVRAGTDEVVRVEKVHRESERTHYTVAVNGRLQMVTEEGLTELVHEPSDPSTWIRAVPASADELAVGLTVTKLTNPLTDTVYSYLSSKTVFRPYQFRPVLRMLDSPHQRLLIADEVGLGKTIEAGLIWSELEARNRQLNRVLIVCPAVLTQKWQDEMGRRFDRRVVMVDTAVLSEFMSALESGDESAPLIGVVSLERLRSSKLLADLNDLNPHFDLIIVDEAHYLRNRATRANQLGELLSTWAHALVFLSATPLNLGTDDLFNLLNLLVPEEFNDQAIFDQQLEPNIYLNAAAARLHHLRDRPAELLELVERIHECRLPEQVTDRVEYGQLCDLLSRNQQLDHRQVADAKRLLLDLNTLSSVVTRTRKVDVPDAKAVREPRSIDVIWSDEEARLYQAILHWARARAKASGGVPGFVTQMPLRQAASCLPAAVELIRAKDPTAFQRSISGDSDFDDFDDMDDLLVDDDASDTVDLSDLAAAVEAASGRDTKFDRFAEALREVESIGSSQVLVFSFFRRTLGYLHERLTALGYRSRVMHGGVKVADRQKIMSDFRAGEFEILLSSEVGSEGLDFEFCNVVVNYDMPWNPMRVEQRIGRLDRFGQEHEIIFVFNFHVPGTIETDIFERLYERINVFRASIGELEPILRDEFNTITRIALDPSLSDEQRRLRLDQIEVAIEERSKQMDDIEAARAYLSGIDEMLIDGFEQDTTSRGRFVGPQELQHLLEHYFGATRRGRLRAVAGHPSRRTLVGTKELGDEVSRLGQHRSGTRYRLSDLTALLRDEVDIEITFSNDDASRNGVELISLRHPVVRAAVKHYGQLPMGVQRFAAVSVPGLPDHTARYLTVLYLAETTGLRPSLELWPIAVDLATNEISQEAGYALLAAVADGDLVDAEMPPLDSVEACLERITAIALQQQHATEAERRRNNDLLVDTRLATRRASIEFKIARAEDTLRLVRRDRRSGSVIRMHEGTIRNLTDDLERVGEEMEQRRHLSLNLTPVAVAVLEPRERGTAPA